MVAKKKSGAQRRKEKAASFRNDAAIAAAGFARTREMWLEQAAYTQGYDPNEPPIQLPIYGQPPPTFVQAVQAAVNQLEIGNFYLPSILWDGMGRDDRVTSSLNTRIMGLLGMPTTLTPGGETKRAQRMRDEVEKLERFMLPPPQVGQLMRYGIGLSVGIAQRKTVKTLKSWTPTIEVWNPRFLWWDWLIRRYRLTTENQGTIVIDPEDPEWLVWEPYGPLGWLHGAALRALALPWIIRFRTRQWWARYQEVHGEPIRLGIIPPERTPADERLFLTQIGNFAHEAVIRLPQGSEGNRFDVKLLEATSNNWQGFERLLQHCDRSIEIALLGQYQSTEGQGGLGTQERAGESTLLKLLRGDALIGDLFRNKIFMPYVSDNYANAKPEDLAPYLEWQIDPPEDLDKKSRAFAMVAKGFATFPPDVMKYINVRTQLESFQLDLLPEDEVEDPPDPCADHDHQPPNGDEDKPPVDEDENEDTDEEDDDEE